MMKFILSLALTGGLLAASIQEADAARMGGGRSFGSRPSYSAPFQRSPSPAAGAFQRQPSPAQARNQTLRDGLAQRSGFGRFLGGLALGGLLGAMFMGGGFEHINFLDILVFAGLAFLLMKLFAARRARSFEPASAAEAPPAYAREAHEGGARFETDVFSRGASGAAGAPASADIPRDFDQGGFLEGAKGAYRMLQAAWDRGDLAELRGLTTDKVFGELQEQLRTRGSTPNQTDLLDLSAEILEVKDLGSDRVVSVLFDALLRESPGAEAEKVREVWHFTRSRQSRQPTWYLDGIQQVSH